MDLDQETLKKLKDNPGMCFEVIPLDETGREEPHHVSWCGLGPRAILDDSDYYKHDCECSPELVHLDIKNQNHVWEHRKRA